MNLNETILQKLEEMEDRQKTRETEIEARQKERYEALETRMIESEARQKERHEALETRITSIDTEVKDLQKNSAEQKVHQTKLEGDLQLLDSDLKGQLGRLETKFDAFIANMREQKTDTNERWKVGGIIVSCGIAVASLGPLHSYKVWQMIRANKSITALPELVKSPVGSKRYETRGSRPTTQQHSRL